MSKPNSEPKNPQFSEAFLIEKEKQKTARSRNMYVFFGIIIIASLIALFYMLDKGGKGGIEADFTEGKFKFTVDKPIVEQANTEKKSFTTPEGKNVDYTTGRVSQNVIREINDENITFSPYLFVGENLINDAAGYIVSSANPGMWNVQYNPAGLSDPLIPINTFSVQDGSHMNVNREAILIPNIQDYVLASISTLINYNVIADYPEVSYADDNRTAFLTFTNIAANGQSFMKVVKGASFFYIVTANYNLGITNYDIQEELISMVANFTIIE